MSVVRKAIASVVLDRGTSTATVTRHDGVTSTLEFASPVFEASSGVARVIYLPAEDSMRLVTVRGDEIIAELPAFDDASPLRGRAVVYLDQKDWSLLANTVHEPSRVAPADRDAAHSFIAWVNYGRIVLPMSGAHMTETCKWANRDRRYRLALTITRLSRGWQMRSPLAMRRHEFRRSLLATLRGSDTEPVPAITLEPGALHPPDMVIRSQRFDGFPSDLGHALTAVTSVIGIFDTMLDAEATIPGPIPGWVERQQAFTDWLEDQAAPRAQQDRMIDEFFLSDAVGEIAQVLASEQIAPDEIRAWLGDQDGVVANMPSLGVFREVLRGKHLDSATTWESNDLTDMMYLCCAAGYADHVVGERATIAHIEQAARRLGRTVSVHRRIRDLVPLLKAESG